MILRKTYRAISTGRKRGSVSDVPVASHELRTRRKGPARQPQRSSNSMFDIAMAVYGTAWLYLLSLHFKCILATGKHETAAIPRKHSPPTNEWRQAPLSLTS